MYMADKPAKLKAEVKLAMQLGTNANTRKRLAGVGFGGFG